VMTAAMWRRWFVGAPGAAVAEVEDVEGDVAVAQVGGDREPLLPGERLSVSVTRPSPSAQLLIKIAAGRPDRQRTVVLDRVVDGMTVSVGADLAVTVTRGAEVTVLTAVASDPPPPPAPTTPVLDDQAGQPVRATSTQAIRLPRAPTVKVRRAIRGRLRVTLQAKAQLVRLEVARTCIGSALSARTVRLRSGRSTVLVQRRGNLGRRVVRAVAVAGQRVSRTVCRPVRG
jgi:hypothetical protein